MKTLLRELAQATIPRRYRYGLRAAVLAAISPLFAGDNVECPACGKSARRWASLTFPESVCPHCFAFGRQRLMALYIQNELQLGQKPMTVLHFAAEPYFMRYFKEVPNLTYIAADLDPPSEAVRMDITDIALDDGSVDVVICSHVLEHVPDDAKAIREIKRVLAPGGLAMVLVPVHNNLPSTYEDPSITSPKDRLEAFHQRDHVRLYGADFEDRLGKCGVTVTVNRYAQSLGDEAIARYGLRKEEIIYICT